jgi:membrane fusion protein (multidrug efflux system)
VTPRLPRRAAALLLALLPPFALLPRPGRAQQMPPSVVSTTVAQSLPWQERITAPASLRAEKGADLAPEIAGIVDQLGFESGEDVAAGTVLMRLALEDAPARLAELQAAAELAAANLARDLRQFHAEAVSQATIDADQSTLREARARVAQQQALMDDKVLRAPFAGRLGLRQVDLGQYLQPGTVVVTLQALDPLFADFFVPQRDLPRLLPGQPAEVTVDAWPGRRFAGRITAISPKVDPASRMAQVRATLRNPGHALLPGMFAEASVAAGPPRPEVTIPSAALVFAPYGTSVFVVRPGSPPTVEQRMVRTGATRGDQVAVTSGLAAGETVVTAGQIKLRPGAAVAVNNAVRPADDPDPHPREE